MPVRFGLENLIKQGSDSLKGKKLGLLCNPASVDAGFEHASVLIQRCFKNQLTTLFSPQHGFYAEKQDNMIESGHMIDPVTGLKVYSLYGDTRKPTDRMFDDIDVLLVDIQDVGTRVYTFIYTISYCLETAAQTGKTVIILDRPNPIGGLKVEGSLLEEAFSSFVGRFPIPMRHGMTVGEIIAFFNREFNIRADLEVIPMTGWKRSMYWKDTGRVWIAPSPNLPTPLSCMTYPGQVILEGTNISEGRGTTLPFEQFGAPYIEPHPIVNNLAAKLEGLHLRVVTFEPTSGKWANERCTGFHIHVTDPLTYNSYQASLTILQKIMQRHPDGFAFKQPPYEYEYEKLPMDLILGSKSLREAISSGTDLSDMFRSWEADIKTFIKKSRTFYQYE